ncbi:MAG: isoleucine--tRNA ligase [Candidatus Eremiobacter antarcticus]|nr:isoleucine--tRNA ligase [Candidatus Eremiobacteraeota bacterium]PZR60865.1 MAG: isoleucine--tRNA ligase [Candidatus Eremiobacter sp. RRmetagenome_bin22]
MTALRFPPIPDKPDNVAREQAVLTFWRDQRVFERSLEQTKSGARYSFYEGPPTANGKPGVHHVLARAFKDLYPRFHTMRGRYVPRKAGWDTHGLPVEHEIEKELGILDKSRIEAEVGIAEFTRRCRESVFRYVADWNRMTERMGYWVDLSDPYVSLNNDYIETVWWIFKQLWDRGFIVQDYKSVPYDPRIGATLSDHEVAQGYRMVDDPSVYVRFRRSDNSNTSFLAWTTTPWTLPANMALAVHPDVTYCVVERSGERLIVAEPLMGKVFHSEDVRIVEQVAGAALAGIRYEPLYSYCTSAQDKHYVIPATFVTTEDGTGIVHIAPAYGPDDLALGKAHDLPIYYSVDYTGHVVEEVAVGAGLFFKDADKPIIADLQRRGLMFRSEMYRHNYPFGWRTGDPLLYIAKTAWFIRTTAFKDRLLANNEQINWVPETIKHGRFGNWLENNVDWAISRERFWGTPMPVWTDGVNHVCMGSLAELEERCGRDLPQLDLHRPAIDDVTFVHEGREYRRVPEVLDAWFDSGSMPYAQFHYPFAHGDGFRQSFPADFICEAVDQTRGWFYSLHAIATMLFDSPAYKNVICLGLVVDAAGEKMSKSRGNVLDPYSVFDTLGADALRWYFITGSPPGDSKRVSLELIEDGSHRLIRTLWNTAKFFSLYANADGIGRPEPVDLSQRTDLDRWAVGELAQLTADVTALLENYDAQTAGRAIERFVDDLSNWYVRLSRDRFWGSGVGPDKRAAYATLYECLTGVTLLLAPFTPFLAESLYQYLVAPVDSCAGNSVHLCAWPQVQAATLDESLLQAMNVARQAVDLGRQARAGAKIKTRQPLRAAHIRVRSEADRAALLRFRSLVLDELNVKDMALVGLEAQFIEYGLRPNLPRLGPRFGKHLGTVREALASADARSVATAVAAGKAVELKLDGETFVLEPDDVLVDSKSAHGFAFAENDGMLVALDTGVDRDLLLEGLAREIVRAVQDARKQAGLDVTDRIFLRMRAHGDYEEALGVWRDYIMTETLARVAGQDFRPSFETASSDGVAIALAKADA